MSGSQHCNDVKIFRGGIKFMDLVQFENPGGGTCMYVLFAIHEPYQISLFIVISN